MYSISLLLKFHVGEPLGNSSEIALGPVIMKQAEKCYFAAAVILPARLSSVGPLAWMPALPPRSWPDLTHSSRFGSGFTFRRQ